MKLSFPQSKTGKAALGLALSSSFVVGSCSLQARVFDGTKSLPCEGLLLPYVEGEPAKDGYGGEGGQGNASTNLTKNVCIAVSGEQPKKVGVEQHELGGGRVATTLFLEWDFDGIAGPLKAKKPDAEPITIITDKDGTPLEVQVRSHWRVGKCTYPRYFSDLDTDYSHFPVRVAITNQFHTPVIVGCTPEVLDPAKKGGINTFVFNTVMGYAKAVGQNFIGSFTPLKPFDKNEPPAPDHPARMQPIFVE